MKNSIHDIEKMRYEYRTKNTLALIFPEEFKELKKSEKPDWKDSANNVGVEVVRILDDASLEERKHFSKEIAGKSKSTLSAKTTDELSKYKGSVYTARDLGILDSDVITTHCYTLHEKFDRVLKIIDRKIELLQKCYSNLDKSYLYILYDMNISYSKVEKIFEHCYKTQQKSKKRFCGIFIDDGSKLYRYDFSNGTILEKEILSAAQEIFVMTEMDINGV